MNVPPTESEQPKDVVPKHLRDNGRAGFNDVMRQRIHQFREHLRMPLYRNAYFLMANTASTSALGFVYWIIARRFYSEAAVGTGFVLISATTLLSAFALMNSMQIFARFLPISGRAAGRLISQSYVWCGAAAVVFSTIVVIAARHFTPESYPLNFDWQMGVMFILSVLAWTLYSNLDGAFIAFRESFWVFLRATVFSIAKIFLLIGLAGFASGGAVFASWMITVPIFFVPFHLLMFRRFIPRQHARATGAEEHITFKSIGTFLAGDYVGFLAAQVLLYAFPIMIPLLVRGHEGLMMAACLSLAQPIAGALNLLTFNLMTSLLVESSEDQRRAGHYARLMVRRVIVLVTPAALAIVILAPFILSFGEGYREIGTVMLQLLAISTLPTAVIQLSNSIARVRRRTRQIAITQATHTTFSLLLTALLVPSYGLTGAGLAVLVSATTIALILTPGILDAISPRWNKWRSRERPSLN